MEGEDMTNTEDMTLPAELALDIEPDLTSDLTEDASHRWRIEDDETAEWAMRKLATTQAELAALDEQMRRWTARIQAWRERRAAPLVRSRDFMAERLKDYALALREATGTKSLDLPSGTVSTRASQPKLEIADDDAFVSWALDVAPSLLRVGVARDEIRAALSAGRIRAQDGSDVPLILSMDTGELVAIPGAVLRAEEITASVKVRTDDEVEGRLD